MNWIGHRRSQSGPAGRGRRPRRRLPASGFVENDGFEDWSGLLEPGGPRCRHQTARGRRRAQESGIRGRLSLKARKGSARKWWIHGTSPGARTRCSQEPTTRAPQPFVVFNAVRTEPTSAAAPTWHVKVAHVNRRTTHRKPGHRNKATPGDRPRLEARRRLGKQPANSVFGASRPSWGASRRVINGALGDCNFTR